MLTEKGKPPLRARSIKTAIVVAFMLFAISAFSFVYFTNQVHADALNWKACVPQNETVEKQPGEAFDVEITFKNDGGMEDSWAINIAFEGEDWTWEGESQSLTLKPCHKETLHWTGNVPENATADSIARLIVYYDDEFTPLNWWIHIVTEAELIIQESEVT
jgi:hypothetical protein